jgi:nucleotide-binding universal stress UspA family protein
MLDHILIPLDGSVLAEEAISPTKQILKANGRITLLSVVEVPTSWESGMAPVLMLEESKSVTDRLMARAKAYLEGVAENLRAENFTVSTNAQYGVPATIIVDTALAQKVDAISMSTHGRSGFSRWLFGSVTSKVLSTAPCPVFVIPPKHDSATAETAQAVSHQQA